MVRLSSTVAAAAAALLMTLPFVSAIPEDKTVKYTYERRRISAEEAESFPSLAKRQSKTVNAQISNEYLLYLINVTVGTPPQPISLQLDTGSSDIWFPSASSSVCTSRRTGYICDLVGAYNQYNSSTYRQSQYASTPFEIAYVDGSQIAGTYVNDVLNIGSTKLTNVTMASATQLSRALGIMGVGFQEGESSNVQGGFTYPNVINSLKDQGYINVLSYSLWLDDLDSDTGSILFGGVDTDKYHGSLTALPIQKDSDSNAYTSFTVAWTGLTVSGSGNSGNFSPTTPQPAIFDSGTTLTYLPDSIANNIYNGVGVTIDQDYGNIVPCKIANDNLVFTFTFGGANGARVNVSLSELVFPIETSGGSTPRYRNGDTACQFGIESAGSNPILFGDTFLRSAYVVYDLENLQIGLAQTNFNASPGTGNVVALSAGAGIPGASSTASGATVAQTFVGRTSITGAQTVTATGTAGASGTRTATFSLSAAAASSTGAMTTGKSAAGRAEVDKSIFAVLAVTLGAFFFGAMLL